MRIESSIIAMSSMRRYESESRRDEKLEVWIDPPASNSTDDTVTLLFSGLPTDGPGGAEHAAGGEEIVESDPKLLIIKGLLEAFTGRKIRLASISGPEAVGAVECSRGGDDGAQAEPAEGWGLRYDYSETRTESEQTAFSAGGIVRTGDGRELAFTLDLRMSREFAEQTGISIRAGDAARIDPLVINFAGRAAELTDWRFNFDLDSDGSAEAIPFVTQGSGLLVFDRNRDGAVSNGSELFGPSTGNGFGELARLDADGNGWIDENDSAYDGLYVWTRDADGNAALSGLKASGVGALNVACSDSPFDLRDENNLLKGQIIRTGIYLRESGSAGSIQQLDLFV